MHIYCWVLKQVQNKRTTRLYNASVTYLLCTKLVGWLIELFAYYYPIQGVNFYNNFVGTDQKFHPVTE